MLLVTGLKYWQHLKEPPQFCSLVHYLGVVTQQQCLQDFISLEPMVQPRFSGPQKVSRHNLIPFDQHPGTTLFSQLTTEVRFLSTPVEPAQWTYCVSDASITRDPRARVLNSAPLLLTHAWSFPLPCRYCAVCQIDILSGFVQRNPQTKVSMSASLSRLNLRLPRKPGMVRSLTRLSFVAHLSKGPRTMGSSCRCLEKRLPGISACA